VSHAHFWDITAFSSLDKIIQKFQKEGTDIDIIGMNKATAALIDRFGA
jgi:SulP family sulfate permease